MANIWSLKGVPVIPTNGVVNPRGYAVMGAGLAKQASERYPDLPALLGLHLTKHGNTVCWFPKYNLITFPTKEHWKDKSPLGLLETSTLKVRELARKLNPIDNPILIPRVGCGLGGLNWDRQVKPMILEYLHSEISTGLIRLVE